MKQRDASRKRSRTSPSGTDGFRIPKPGRINDPGDRFSRVERESRAKIRGIRSRWSPPPPFGEVSPFVDSVGEAELYEGTAMGKRKKEQRIRTFRIYIYILLVTFLPVRGGWIPVRDARYHNGVFQPGGHINHLLVYHRRHGAAYLCEKKTDKSCNDSEDGNDT